MAVMIVYMVDWAKVCIIMYVQPEDWLRYVTTIQSSALCGKHGPLYFVALLLPNVVKESSYIHVDIQYAFKAI